MGEVEGEEKFLGCVVWFSSMHILDKTRQASSSFVVFGPLAEAVCIVHALDSSW